MGLIVSVSKKWVRRLREDLLENCGHIMGGECVIIQVEVAGAPQDPVLEKSLAGHVSSLAEDAFRLEALRSMEWWPSSCWHPDQWWLQGCGRSLPAYDHRAPKGMRDASCRRLSASPALRYGDAPPRALPQSACFLGKRPPPHTCHWLKRDKTWTLLLPLNNNYQLPWGPEAGGTEIFRISKKFLICLRQFTLGRMRTPETGQPTGNLLPNNYMDSLCSK
ncbi:hypothetical protein MAR_015415 [Mya arenaria]|uniref:Uncharacterized protein n=1 Tax=Mya arenaria TaxID=6604 RepID=A0ABY7FL26_MYAAR|nr:hypothetical protein MAR_015415 [Mya arenaria]